MTPNGIPIFNPLEHGIANQPLMVPAHEYDRLLGLLERLVKSKPSHTSGMVQVSDRFMREALAAINREQE